MNTASAPTAGNIASRISVLTSDSSNDVRNDWNPEETLRLLKAIEEYGHDSWIRVAEAVGTKSAAQCVMQFVRFGFYSNMLTFCNLTCFHRLPIEDPFLDDSLPGSYAQLGIPPVFGLSDATLDQNGTAFNQFLTRLLEIGKDQHVHALGAKSGTDLAQAVHGSTSEPAAAALAIAQIAARSKVLAACEEQKFNQYANEALLLQMNRLEKRIEDLQHVESVAGAQGKVHFLKHAEEMWSFAHADVRNRQVPNLDNEMDWLHQMIQATKCVELVDTVGNTFVNQNAIVSSPCCCSELNRRDCGNAYCRNLSRNKR
jgi:hypothetical protein